MRQEQKKSVYIVVSVLFAIILFLYATTTAYQNSNSAKQSTSENYTNIINDVPINIKYDSETYFISGFSSTVAVSLTGSNRLLLQQETNENTRSFSVVADIRAYDAGEIQTDLVVENLPTGVTAMLSPATITVKIGKKETKSFDVQALVPENQIGQGVTIASATTGDDRVKVTSDADTLARIDHVVASLPSTVSLYANYSGSVSLQAVDIDGNVLPSVITPSETVLKITVKTNDSSKSSSSNKSE